ncbi:hypothetical protein DLAC_00084 [Tieghemostelium lacteum]|uniref:Importin N-terminal domain-containing protein n=1 Tax=Tieghemostelium lacteum TaxID=361077 RepID=A0A152A935_TIELA|nr:hypothetical protein DLAC_00084 [Tieghemostelium lacteum]|eukprot:KYR02635.1 hypothetical protein DLAC_00084 [Tieghemostelium lacteum]
MNSIYQALKSANTSNDQTRKEAEEFLKRASEQNFPLFLQTLAKELSNPESDDDTRQLAGLVFKNSISAKDSQTNTTLGNNWKVIDNATRQNIKQQLLNTFPIPNQKPRHTATRVVAHIALIELPDKLWPDLLPQLIQTFKNSTDANIKQAILQTIGYICEDINPETILDFVNPLLEVITLGMMDQNLNVKHAATQALLYALEFAKSNFEIPQERDLIMRVVFENTLCPDNQTKTSAFSNLTKIGTLYYNAILNYMEKIFEVTVSTIQTCQDANVVTQAIEFWTTLAETEFDEEVEPSKLCTLKALPHIMPVLLTTLNKQEEFEDEGAWGITPAGSVCIVQMARLVGDPIVPLVLPFVIANIQSPEWRNRDAAGIAIGSIVDGPTNFNDKNHAILTQLLALLKDTNSSVKDTAAWAIGRICSHQIRSVAPILDQLLGPIMTATTDPSYKVSAYACWTIHNICQAFDEGPVGPFPSLQPVSVLIAQCLITAVHREDANEEGNKLKVNGYEALNSLIHYGSAEPTLVTDILTVILRDFDDSFNKETLGQEDVEDLCQTQILLCSTIQAISSSYKDCIKPQASRIMQNLLKLFTSGSKKSNPIIYEESLLAINSVILALEQEFAPFVNEFFPILKLCIQSVEFGSVPNLAIGIIGDLARTFNNHFTAFAPETIPLVIQALSEPKLPMQYKPPAITCLGDIAFAIGGEIVPYLQSIMEVLITASAAYVDDPDFLNEFRDAILAALSELIHALKSVNKADLFAQYLQHVLNFISVIYADSQRNEELTSSAIGLLGDIMQTIPGPYITNPIISQLVQEGVTKQLQIAKWTQDILKQQQQQQQQPI